MLDTKTELFEFQIKTESSISPPTMFISVDLPQPDGPMTDMNSPCLMSSEIGSSAPTEPPPVANVFATLVRRSVGIVM